MRRGDRLVAVRSLDSPAFAQQVGAYFGRSEMEPVSLRVMRLEGQLVLAAFPDGAASRGPTYFILLELEAGRVTSIRDFRYVPYIAAEAELVDASET